MSDLATITVLLEALFIPVIGLGALLMAKLKTGERARRSEMTFYVVLVVMTAITLRTVITLDKCWLIHTVTLAMMIVGALSIPGQREVEHPGIRNVGV